MHMRTDRGIPAEETRRRWQAVGIARGRAAAVVGVCVCMLCTYVLVRVSVGVHMRE